MSHTYIPPLPIVMAHISCVRYIGIIKNDKGFSPYFPHPLQVQTCSLCTTVELRLGTIPSKYFMWKFFALLNDASRKCFEYLLVPLPSLHVQLVTSVFSYYNEEGECEN